MEAERGNVESSFFFFKEKNINEIVKFSEPKIEEKIYFKETKCKTKTQKATKLGKYAKQQSREPK